MIFSNRLLNSAVTIVLALGAGYAGSVLHGWTSHTGGTIRAARFELVGPDGKTVAFWATNAPTRNGWDSGAVLVFADPRGIRRFELGMAGGNSAPFLRFFGDDKAERIGALLGYDNDPVLLLSDRYGVRAILGATHGDAPGAAEDQWGLSLRARKEGAGAWIGFTRWSSGGYQAGVTLSGGEGRKWTAVAGTPPTPVPLVK